MYHTLEKDNSEQKQENVKHGGLKDFLAVNDNEDESIVNLHPHHHPPKILWKPTFLTFSLSRWWRALVQPDSLLLQLCHLQEKLPDLLLDPVKRNTLKRFCFLWAVGLERRSTGAKCVERCPSSRGTWWGTCSSTLGRETSVVAMAVVPAIRTAGTWRNTRLNVGTIQWFTERRRT